MFVTEVGLYFIEHPGFVDCLLLIIKGTSKVGRHLSQSKTSSVKVIAHLGLLELSKFEI